MILNIILGFIIPWIASLFIVREKKIIYYIAPFASTLSFIIDDFGFYYFWNLYPFELHSISAIPFNVGLFALAPCIMIEFIRKLNTKYYIAVLITPALLTLAELFGLLTGRVFYYDNWNIVLTYFSYFTPTYVNYMFYNFLKNRNLI